MNFAYRGHFYFILFSGSLLRTLSCKLPVENLTAASDGSQVDHISGVTDRSEVLRTSVFFFAGSCREFPKKKKCSAAAAEEISHGSISSSAGYQWLKRRERQVRRGLMSANKNDCKKNNKKNTQTRRRSSSEPRRSHRSPASLARNTQRDETSTCGRDEKPSIIQSAGPEGPRRQPTTRSY